MIFDVSLRMGRGRDRQYRQYRHVPARNADEAVQFVADRYWPGLVLRGRGLVDPDDPDGNGVGHLVARPSRYRR